MMWKGICPLFVILELLICKWRPLLFVTLVSTFVPTNMALFPFPSFLNLALLPFLQLLVPSQNKKLTTFSLFLFNHISFLQLYNNSLSLLPSKYAHVTGSNIRVFDDRGKMNLCSYVEWEIKHLTLKLIVQIYVSWVILC